VARCSGACAVCVRKMAERKVEERAFKMQRGVRGCSMVVACALCAPTPNWKVAQRGSVEQRQGYRAGRFSGCRSGRARTSEEQVGNSTQEGQRHCWWRERWGTGVRQHAAKFMVYSARRKPSSMSAGGTRRRVNQGKGECRHSSGFGEPRTGTYEEGCPRGWKVR